LPRPKRTEAGSTASPSLRAYETSNPRCFSSPALWRAVLRSQSKRRPGSAVHPDLAEVVGEIAGLAARSAQELQRAWRTLHHTARVSRIAPPRFRGIGAVSRSSRGLPSPTYQTRTPWSAPARTASKCISIDKARSTTSFRFSSSCRWTPRGRIVFLLQVTQAPAPAPVPRRRQQ